MKSKSPVGKILLWEKYSCGKILLWGNIPLWGENCVKFIPFHSFIPIGVGGRLLSAPRREKKGIPPQRRRFSHLPRGGSFAKLASLQLDHLLWREI
jgi:hypothetical protein